MFLKILGCLAILIVLDYGALCLAQHALLENGDGSAVVFNSPRINQHTNFNNEPIVTYVYSNPVEWDNVEAYKADEPGDTAKRQQLGNKMLAFLVLSFIVIVFWKIIAMFITHLVFKDQFDWFKERQQEKGRSTSSFVFLFKFFSLLNPESMWRLFSLPDFQIRNFKAVIYVLLMFYLFFGNHRFSLTFIIFKSIGSWLRDLIFKI